MAIDESIRAAALEIFLEVGFESASMDAIAGRAPVSKGTLYARYDSKQQLFRAVMEEELERLSSLAGARDHLLPSQIEQRLRQHAQTVVEIFDTPQFRNLSRLMDAAVRTFPELDSIWQELATGRYLKFLSDDIAAAHDTRHLSKDDRDFLARLFLHSIAGFHRSEVGVQRHTKIQIAAFVDRVIATIVLVVDQYRAT